MIKKLFCFLFVFNSSFAFSQSTLDPLIGKVFDFGSLTNRNYRWTDGYQIDSTVYYSTVILLKPTSSSEEPPFVYVPIYDYLVNLQNSSIVDYNKKFKIIGWFSTTETETDVAGDQYHYYYWYQSSYTPIHVPNCEKPFAIASKTTYLSGGGCCHSICLTDVVSWGYKDPTSDDACGPVRSAYTAEISFLTACPSSQLNLKISEKTLIKLNELISESKSKLGVWAATNSKITDLLTQIKGSLSALLSTNFGVFGTGANSSNPENKNNPNSPEFESDFSAKNVYLDNFQPIISSQVSQCPADISFSVMNASHKISFQSLCDFAQRINPVVIAAARVAAAWLVIGAL